MVLDRRFLVNVGINDLPFPMRVFSKADPDGQPTVAKISINTRIMQSFEARWIDKFIQIVHDHKGRIGTSTLKVNILDYLEELEATNVHITFDYPFFIEKTTPVTKQSNLVSYDCRYAVEVSSIDSKPKVYFGVKAPIITTYPASSAEVPAGLFGQLSVIDLEMQTADDIYPEDVIELIDSHALAPVYSFMSQEDQDFLIQRIHSEEKSSVVVLDELREALAKRRDVISYSLSSANYGMLRSYSTIITTEKSAWVPFSGVQDDI